MPAVDELELLLAPGRSLRPLVLAVADRGGLARQRGPRIVGFEDELDHLPVAFVEVVPVIEDVEEPVLQRELARIPGVGRDVRVDGRLVRLGQLSSPALVVTSGIEGVPGEVEVVLEEPAREVGRGRAHLDQIGRAAPGAAESDRRLVEEDVDVDR